MLLIGKCAYPGVSVFTLSEDTLPPPPIPQVWASGVFFPFSAGFE